MLVENCKKHGGHVQNKATRIDMIEVGQWVSVQTRIRDAYSRIYILLFGIVRQGARCLRIKNSPSTRSDGRDSSVMTNSRTVLNET